MSWGQHTRLVAADGRREDLLAKFVQAVELQRTNPACELMLVSRGTDDSAVYLTEVWSSPEAHRSATESPAVTAWARGMAALVAASPESVEIVPVATTPRLRVDQ